MTETSHDTAPAEGWLAGEGHQPHKHMLGKLPLGTASPEDEFLHPPAASGHFSATETSYFGFSIPEHRLNAEIYLWFHPVLRVMSASVYIWKGFKASSLACEYVNHHHYLPFPAGDIKDLTVDAINLRIRVIEPLKSVQLDFEDRARNVRFSCRQDAVMPPAVRPGGFHFTQAMKTQGELELYGERMKIDGYFSRDRSWGQERREDAMPLPPLGWIVGVFNDDFAFHVLAMDDPALAPEWAAAFPAIQSGQNLIWGYLWKDRQLTPVRAARKLTIRDRDGLTPREIQMELEDASGRRISLRGSVQARTPWQTWQNMNTFFCQTRWECEGEVGYGDVQDVQFNDYTRQFALQGADCHAPSP